MPKEIERKFLVETNEWKSQYPAYHRYKQFYISETDTVSVRIRIDETQLGNKKAWVTVKTAVPGMTRSEAESEINVGMALQAMEMCQSPVIEKLRYTVDAGNGLTWEIDEFQNDQLHGLVIAEIELKTENDVFERPDWLGEEVTDRLEYYNVSLARKCV